MEVGGNYANPSFCIMNVIISLLFKDGTEVNCPKEGEDALGGSTFCNSAGLGRK